ncbi:MAG: 4-(cytidine 5'-diphospho)-2-C-methyl-D-erythritol kinase [Elusimicrobia bacterium]|nr:4-(cytidine 5'-diphospho)-2-C-methyl-D-erythritol kinase [Elusimicrobiota bacterium]
MPSNKRNKLLQSVRILAPAKVNLTLEILGKRKDGYHAIETIFQTVSLYDRIRIFKRENSRSPILLRVLAPQPHSPQNCPADRTNLVWRAADLFFKKFRIRGSCEITLEKNIPAQAGLGGGSSDAAATLLALSKLYNPRTPSLQPTLRTLAAQLGADVPFFLKGGCAWARGIGEKISPLERPKKFWLVIVKPEMGCSTREAYLWFDNASDLKPERLTNQRNVHIIKTSIIERKSAREWGRRIFNSFEKVVFSKIPELKKIKKELIRLGAANASLSGSGSAVYGVVSSLSEGEKIRKRLSRSYPNVWLVHSL